MGKQSGQKLQCLSGNLIANNFLEDTRFIFHTFACKIWLCRQTSRCGSREKMTERYEKLEKVTEHLYAKLHPSNLVNTIFHLLMLM